MRPPHLNALVIATDCFFACFTDAVVIVPCRDGNPDILIGRSLLSDNLVLMSGAEGANVAGEWGWQLDVPTTAAVIFDAE